MNSSSNLVQTQLQKKVELSLCWFTPNPVWVCHCYKLLATVLVCTIWYMFINKRCVHSRV